MLNLGKFIGSVISAVLGIVVVVTIALPILAENQASPSVANADAINAMLGLVPLLLVIAIVVGVVGMIALKGKN